MDIEIGDIFASNDNYFLVIDLLERIDDDYGTLPASARVVPATRQPTGLDDGDNFPIVFRNWAHVGLDYVVLFPLYGNPMPLIELEKLERVAHDTNSVPPCWSVIRKAFSNKGGGFNPLPTQEIVGDVNDVNDDVYNDYWAIINNKCRRMWMAR